MDTWQQRALADPDLSESQVRAITRRMDTRGITIKVFER